MVLEPSSHLLLHLPSEPATLSLRRLNHRRRIANIHALIGVTILTLLSAIPAVAADDAEGLTLFEQRIRPVLVEQCYSCHSAEAAKKKELKSGLYVDSREGLRRGGESGPAVVPGKVDESLIVGALRHESFKMPPAGRLSAAVVADFERWIKLGAPDPREIDTAAQPHSEPKIDIDRARREHWAFQPLNTSKSPQVENAAWCVNDIDRYILAKLESRGLKPSPAADRHTLIRRVSFDLIGLPPSPEDIAAFVDDSSPDAYARLVDRLLASPQYGERWGRHWLDLARYADSSGFHSDLDRPNAWRYRDYVIDSFNDDKPYAQFIAEQIAGDELAPASDESRIATAFGCNGPSNDDNMGTGKAKERYRLDLLDDTIATTSTVFMGLTLGCARCHDHKIDPISALDYYRFLAVFNTTERQGGPVTKSAMKNSEGKPLPTIQSLVETSAKPRQTFLLRRGNLDFPGVEVEPGVPAVLLDEPLKFPTPALDARSTGRRRILAEWLGSFDNALVYRVLANRVWQHHFGRGIVATPSNFGFGGEPPSHPELLDSLARQVIDHGGRIKPLHRMIVLSNTYQQRATAEPIADDLNNTLVARRTPRRLEAEALRDAVLAASGRLNPAMGGTGIKPRIRAELIDTSQRNKWPELKSEGPVEWRRSVYIYVKRQLLMPMMELFDAPTTTDSCPDRSHNVVPTQSLVLMNDEFIEDQAKFLADRAIQFASDDLFKAVERVQLSTLGKPMSARRREQAQQFVMDRERVYRGQKATAAESRRRALADLAHVMFNSSEFVYVE